MISLYALLWKGKYICNRSFANSDSGGQVVSFNLDRFGTACKWSLSEKRLYTEVKK